MLAEGLVFLFSNCRMQLIRLKNGEMNAVGDQQLKERKGKGERERENGEQRPQHG